MNNMMKMMVDDDSCRLIMELLKEEMKMVRFKIGDGLVKGR